MFLCPVVNHHQPVFMSAHYNPVGIDMQMFGYNFIVYVKIANQNKFRKIRNPAIA